MHLRSLLRHPFRLILLLAGLFALSVILGAVLFHKEPSDILEDNLFRLSDLQQWKPVYLDRGTGALTCHLVYPFAYADPALGEQFGVLSINGQDADLKHELSHLYEAKIKNMGNFKVSAEFRKRFRERALDADLKLNELLVEALDAWERVNGLKK